MLMYPRSAATQAPGVTEKQFELLHAPTEMLPLLRNRPCSHMTLGILPSANIGPIHILFLRQVSPGGPNVELEKFLYSQKEAAASVALSRRSITHYIAKGELETRRIGRRVLITRESLRRFASKNHFESIRPLSKSEA